MKNQKLSKMTEDEIWESHCDAIHELAGLAFTTIKIQRDMQKLTETIEKLDLEIESRESKSLKQENKLN